MLSQVQLGLWINKLSESWRLNAEQLYTAFSTNFPLLFTTKIRSTLAEMQEQKLLMAPKNHSSSALQIFYVATAAVVLPVASSNISCSHYPSCCYPECNNAVCNNAIKPATIWTRAGKFKINHSLIFKSYGEIQERMKFLNLIAQSFYGNRLSKNLP